MLWGVPAWLAIPLRLSLEGSPVSARRNVIVLAIPAFFLCATGSLLDVTFFALDVTLSPGDDLLHRISRLLRERFIELPGPQAVLESLDEELLVRIRYLDGGVIEPGKVVSQRFALPLAHIEQAIGRNLAMAACRELLREFPDHVVVAYDRESRKFYIPSQRSIGEGSGQKFALERVGCSDDDHAVVEGCHVLYRIASAVEGGEVRRFEVVWDRSVQDLRRQRLRLWLDGFAMVRSGFLLQLLLLDGLNRSL